MLGDQGLDRGPNSTRMKGGAEQPPGTLARASIALSDEHDVCAKWEMKRECRQRGCPGWYSQTSLTNSSSKVREALIAASDICANAKKG